MRTYKVSEIFGPTMAGEGYPAGRQCAFIRLLLCDGDGKGNRCSWCDTKYTWDTTTDLFAQAKEMTAEDIVSKLDSLPWPGEAARPLISLSGGNPVLQLSPEKDMLMQELVNADYDVHIETQGSIWKPSVSLAKSITVSPKPPSSGINSLSIDAAAKWALQATKDQRISYKFVVFDDDDFAWTEEMCRSLKLETNDAQCVISYYLQPGTTNTGDPVEAVLSGYRALVARWIKSSVLEDCVVLPQLHVLLWGRKIGV